MSIVYFVAVVMWFVIFFEIFLCKHDTHFRNAMCYVIVSYDIEGFCYYFAIIKL